MTTELMSVAELALAHGAWLAARLQDLRVRFPQEAGLLGTFADYVSGLYERRTKAPVPKTVASHQMSVGPAEYALLEEVARIACEAGDFSKFVYYYGDREEKAAFELIGVSVSVFKSQYFSIPAAAEGGPTPRIAWREDSWIRRHRPDYAARFPIE